jgi:dihydropteroate synthase
LIAKVTPFSSKKTLNLGGKLLYLDNPLVMGILNITPDSFYQGSRFNDAEDLTKKLEQMIQEQVDIVDIGGYSSRPGAENISVQEEIDRVIPAIIACRAYAPSIPISIDTYRTEVASQALDAGANMINDISAGSLDPKMFRLVAQRQVPYILMHMRGNPQTMTGKTDYQNIITDIMRYFSQKVSQLQDLGVNDIIVDPGFGFAKTVEQNYELLRNLSYFNELQLPLLVGLSRKSMVYRPLDISADEALNGTTVLHTIALMNGAMILRVHDVQAARQAITLYLNTYPNH